MNRRRRVLAGLSAALAAAIPLLAAGSGGAQDHAAHPAGHAAEPPAEATATPIPLTAIPEAALTDQDGNRVLLYEDLIAGRVVAINFIFTTCTTICPVMGATFARLQHEMAERPGAGEVRYISLSIDPGTDTPERLKAWSDRYRGRYRGTDRWTLLTGRQRVIDDLLKSLGVFTALKEDHAPLILMGNDATGTWVRAYGLAPPDELAESLGALLDESP